MHILQWNTCVGQRGAVTNQKVPASGQHRTLGNRKPKMGILLRDRWPSWLFHWWAINWVTRCKSTWLEKPGSQCGQAGEVVSAGRNRYRYRWHSRCVFVSQWELGFCFYIFCWKVFAFLLFCNKVLTRALIPCRCGVLPDTAWPPAPPQTALPTLC